ncbi:NAD(P)/FAD-dependent oxidoreductase [Candidatus Woesearchaeota archaeon]|nr:NAD(P)/FAD-dependent oxidoreductase [Candidatus Woesearchaeota archaeon]
MLTIKQKGCASAYYLSKKFENVFVFEKHEGPGRETSERNSGIIHTGIYYKSGSLKARLCVRGNPLLYQFCSRNKVPNRKTGKLIVASSHDEISGLVDLKLRGERNGVEGLEIISKVELHQKEPNCKGVAALYSPNTGVLDQTALVRTMECLAKENGSEFLYNTRVNGIQVKGENVFVNTNHERNLEARVLINCAGLYADEIAKMLGNNKWQIHPCRGEYYKVSQKKSGLVTRSIYPLPKNHGLGVHVTKTTHDELLLGPNVVFVNEKDDYERTHWVPKGEFFNQASRIIRGLSLEDLSQAYSGIRPKLNGKNVVEQSDFILEFDELHSNAVIIHFVGWESPGLTCCIPAAQYLVEMLERRLG